MKSSFMKFFDLEDSEIELKDVVEAGAALLVTIGFVFAPFFL